MKTKNYITPSGHKKLVDRYEFLSQEERPKVVETVSWAASLGDRSENADYQYGKRRLREIDKELGRLAGKLESAELIDPTLMSTDKVQFGATVTIETDADKKIQYVIVGVDEIDLEKNRISWKSPIGSALLGKEKGDQITVKTPHGEEEMEIIDIIYQRIE